MLAAGRGAGMIKFGRMLCLGTTALAIAGSGAWAQEAAPAKATTWERLTDSLRPLGARILTKAPGPRTEQTEEEIYLMMASALAQGVVNGVYANPDYPLFVPLHNDVFNHAGPVPDYMYWRAPVDGGGRYRLSGYRGTTRYVEINIRAGDEDDGKGGGRTVGLIDLDKLTRDADGYFSVLLSGSKPEGYSGDWVRLDAGATNLMVRSAAYDWKHEIDPRLAIERLDRPAPRPRPSPAHIRERFAALPDDVDHLVVTRIEKTMGGLRRQGAVNRTVSHDYSKVGGVIGQVYNEGLYELADDEALIVEVEVPRECRYWSLMALNDHYETVDWVNRQSSLNGLQARIDGDGRFRAVLSNRDPGVPNWIDTGGYNLGVYKLRWNNCSSNPVPISRKVRLSEVRRLLPRDTPAVTPEQRDRELRDRREGAQLRRRW